MVIITSMITKTHGEINETGHHKPDDNQISVEKSRKWSS